ncbi:MAG TPA: gephyrin-like molybdotransferase Glp [Solirubrobacterales bacterium]|jgi:molybdopterin molybdotransferase|nr:gephyrin-like molybdotransferase Glp [Solirubrobacterales bacterium]
MARAIGIEAARREVLARVRRTAVEEVGLGEALGRRIAVDAIADGPFQPFDNSAMDGFAVRAEDVSGASGGAPVALSLVAESRAGRPAERSLMLGEAIAISTGAMLPVGADAVVRVEDTEREAHDRGGRGTVGPGREDPRETGDRLRDRVLVSVAVATGANVRRAGEDIAAGETVLRAGAELGPAELGALATIGLDPAPVHRRPRVAVLTSGDELTLPGRPLGPGGIRDSNSRTVPGLARLAGAEVVSVDWTPDEPEATRAALARALEADVAIVCGGVSVGEHDHVKAALAELGAEEVFWRVALKPGGPTWFGTRGETLAFGLPGNPVSVMVTFLTFVRPALIVMAGGDPASRRVTARLGADYEKPTDRAHAVRCRLELDERGWIAWPLPRQGSHVLTSMLAADALALVPAESAGLAAGETVEVELLDRASMGR